MKTSRLLSVATLLVACGCSDLSFEAEIKNREAFAPPPQFTAWWSATEVCSGRTGSLDRIEWFLAQSIVVDGAIALGAWIPPHEIIIVNTAQDAELVVRHEMLHDLLGGDSDHALPVWQTCDLIPR